MVHLRNEAGTNRARFTVFVYELSTALGVALLVRTTCSVVTSRPRNTLLWWLLQVSAVSDGTTRTCFWPVLKPDLTF